jgi:DNA mismatch endonuclease (patch repair protein)
MDVVDAATRSRMMSGIGHRDTQPEMAVRRYLHACGLRFRLHDRQLPGRPDLVLPRYRTAILVHGCFWHRHLGCRYATTPATRPQFWQRKFEINARRDAAAIAALKFQGWHVRVIWECECRDPQELDRLFWYVVTNAPIGGSVRLPKTRTYQSHLGGPDRSLDSG